MRVLLVHPNLDLWAGGEYIALKTIEALQRQDHEVVLATEPFDPKGAESWEGEKILENTRIIDLPRPLGKHGRSLQRLIHLDDFRQEVKDLGPDKILNTQLSTYHLPGISFAYHPGDLDWFWGSGKLLNRREIYYRLLRRMIR